MNYFISVFLAILSTICAAMGQIGLKIGSMRLKKDFKAIITNYALFIGIFFYGLSTVLFVVALKGNELSVLYPLAGLNYVWVSLMSMKILNEKMNKYKWIGIGLIIIGVIFVV